jgi:hypothetical protein
MASVSTQAETTSTVTTTTTAVQTSTLPFTGTTAVTSTTGATNSGPLEGTILANRSETMARFFLEGQTYQLEAGLSQGIALPRATTVLNLFNCAGDLADNTAGCFWDPYLIQQDGFYEIYNSAEAGAEPTLMLREAGAPPTGQVWVQNRTDQTESVVFRDTVYELEPTAVLEFPVAAGVPAILYVRNCLTIDSQSACEWAPKSLDAGVYYAMLEQDTPGSQNGSTRTTIELRPIVGDGEESAQGTAVAPASGPAIVCTVIVPTLNVRSGPGLQYDIIGKVRTTDGSTGTINVTGRSTDNEWLTVDPSVAANGWINNSPSFITCSGDVAGLPIVEAPAPPTPQPSIVEVPPVTGTTAIVQETATTTAPPATEGTTGSSVPAEATAEATTEASVAIPAGQSLLVVNNGFQHQMRFTLDQMYRPQEGPSEIDLQPGESISIVVFPGDIPFTASSPWSGLSGNASVHLEADESLTLWLRFEPEQGGNWVFRWN